MSTLRELLARNLPGVDLDAVPPPASGPRRLSGEEQAELWRERAVRRHQLRVPAPFAAARLDCDTPREVRAWVQAHIAGTAGARHSLMLFGRVGRGKTWLAYAALAEIAYAGVRNAAWAGGTVAEVFTRMRPGSGEDRATVFRDLADAPILLLDDLGAARSSDWTEETFLDLIDTRSRRNGPVIVTTNATPQELRAAIGDRALSRLAGMCVQYEFPADAPDRRLA
jgi:DNA replication protein DnaC